LSMCGKILSFEGDSEEVYFMKLEALWTLTNISRGEDSNEVKLILGHPNNLKPKFEYSVGQSLLSLIDKTLRQLQSDNM
jgi:hypothetical protein